MGGIYNHLHPGSLTWNLRIQPLENEHNLRCYLNLKGYDMCIHICIYTSANNRGFLITAHTNNSPWNLGAPTICSTGRHQTPCDLKTIQAFAVPGVFQTRYVEGFFPGEGGWFCCNQKSKEQKMHETWDIISWRLILKLFIMWLHKRLKHAIPRPNDSTLLFVKWKNHHSSIVSNAAWQHITFCVTLTSVANMSHVFAAVAPTGFPAVHFLLSRAGPFVKFGHPCTGDIKWCYHDKLQPSWWLNQPIWNIWSSNWKSSPNSCEHNKYLKPPPSKYQSVASTCQTTLAVFPFPFQARQQGGTREKKGHLLPLAPLA